MSLGGLLKSPSAKRYSSMMDGKVFFVDFDLALDETLIFVVLDWKNDAHVLILPAVFSYRLAHAGDSSSSNITQLG